MNEQEAYDLDNLLSVFPDGEHRRFPTALDPAPPLDLRLYDIAERIPSPMNRDGRMWYGPYWMTDDQAQSYSSVHANYSLRVHVCDDPIESEEYGNCGHMEFIRQGRNPF